jgi:hypothetical protein
MEGVLNAPQMAGRRSSTTAHHHAVAHDGPMETAVSHTALRADG